MAVAKYDQRERRITQKGRRQKAEGRRQKAEGRRQKAESKRQKGVGQKEAEPFGNNPVATTQAFSVLRNCNRRCRKDLFPGLGVAKHLEDDLILSHINEFRVKVLRKRSIQQKTDPEPAAGQEGVNSFV